MRPIFDVTIAQEVNIATLGWPKAGEATDDGCLGCNRLYVDLRGLSWTEAKRVFDLEGRVIARIEGAEDTDEVYETIDEELYESDENLLGLDMGVASSVASLSAARCIPFTSCNAGAFGGHHHEAYPLIAFFARPQVIDLLLPIAIDAKVGLVNEPGGGLVAYSDDIIKFRNFAAELIHRSRSFDDLRLGKAGNRFRRYAGAEQYRLPLDEITMSGDQ
jgi:hypothetical protein